MYGSARRARVGTNDHALVPTVSLWTALIVPRDEHFQSVCFQMDHIGSLPWSGHGPVLLLPLHQGRDRASAGHRSLAVLADGDFEEYV
jgi:hypothetical protein